MPNFAVEIEGRGYLLQFEPDEPPAERGFFTCVGLSAASIEDAADTALDVVRNTERLNAMMRNRPGAEPEPMLFVEAVYELGDEDDVSEWDRGFVFYTDTEDDAEESAV